MMHIKNHSPQFPHRYIAPDGIRYIWAISGQPGDLLEVPDDVGQTIIQAHGKTKMRLATEEEIEGAPAPSDEASEPVPVASDQYANRMMNSE